MKNIDKCPEKETLKKFLAHELTEEMNERIFHHLELCENCQHTVRCLLTEEKNLLQKLFQGSIQQKGKQLSSAKECLSKTAILAYANKCLDENQLKLVESHLENCDNCLTSLIELQRAGSISLDIKFDTRAIMEALKKPNDSRTDILEIVLKVKKDIFELIKHTGELLSLSPQFGAVRGKIQQNEQVIVIRKDIKNRELSIQVTLHKKITEQKNIKVSVMKLSNEQFIPEIEVSLSGRGVHQQEQTNEEGIAGFYCITTGSYDININGVTVSSITIN